MFLKFIPPVFEFSAIEKQEGAEGTSCRSLVVPFSSQTMDK